MKLLFLLIFFIFLVSTSAYAVGVAHAVARFAALLRIGQHPVRHAAALTARNAVLKNPGRLTTIGFSSFIGAFLGGALEALADFIGDAETNPELRESLVGFLPLRFTFLQTEFQIDEKEFSYVNFFDKLAEINGNAELHSVCFSAKNGRQVRLLKRKGTMAVIMLYNVAKEEKDDDKIIPLYSCIG